MNTFARKFLAATLSIAGITLAASAVAQTDVLRVGVLSALSGPGSEWGLAMDGGMKIAAMEVNAKGGLKVGAKTYKVEVTSYDDQYKAAMSVTGATRLIEQDKIKFAIGPLGSAAVLAVKPLYEKNKVLAIMGGYSDKVVDKDSKYTFRGYPTQPEFAGPIVDWLKKNRPNLKTVVQIDMNDESGWATQKLIQGFLDAAGYKVLSHEFIERNLKDFQPVLTRVLASKPDIIQFGSPPAATIGLIVRQARELGFTGQFVNLGGPGVPLIVGAAGKEFAEGLITYAAADTSAKTFKDLEAQYAKVLKPPMNEFAVYFYDAARMLLQAIQTAGTVDDTDKVRAALENIKTFDGIQGKIQWGGAKNYGTNHQIYTPIFVGTIKNGEQAILGRVE